MMQTMKSTRHPRRAAMLFAAAALVLAPTLVAAQAIYRIVGPDGRVTFSDKPPANNGKATTLGSGGRSADNAEGAADLPFELREVINRYPVTLYTSANCELCDAGRKLLQSRGIPFRERTIATEEDIEARKRMGLEGVIPIVVIGNQRIKGYSEVEWNEYLDLAKYPKTSRLPAGYRNPPPAPLAPASGTASDTRRSTAPATQTPPPPPPPSGPTPDNPTGIVF